jgi:hypothetical protein
VDHLRRQPSPWNTHLSSEEYEPDATHRKNTQFANFSTNLYGDATKANPYHYGHLPEITVNPDGTGSSRSTTAWAASRTNWCR